MDIKHVAAILLVGHIVSASFMLLVVRRQRALTKLPIDSDLLPFRRTLNRLSVAILIGNIIPILIDILTITAHDSLRREDSPSGIGIIYGISNAVTAVISAYLIWTLYKQAAKTVLIVDQATEDALRKK